MITLYGGPTTNTHKISIALEELSLDYKEHYISLPKKEQLEPWFIEISPNNKFPVLHDESKNVTIWESAAIILYLCENYDQDGVLLHKIGASRYTQIQYTMFQVANIGPTFGRLNDQLMATGEEKNQFLINKLYTESARLIEVLVKLLKDGRPHLAGEYSIADIMHYPWLQAGIDREITELTQEKNIVSWAERVQARSAVERGMAAFLEYA